jgi:erythronate-4-phosphate dehydrogenase
MYFSIDKNIPLLPDILQSRAKVRTFEGRKLQNSELMDTEVLFVRSTTKVNEELIKNTPVKLVGTATSGTEHIDIDYLKKNKIYFGDAKGCNANSVAEYVIYAILKWHFEYGYEIKNKTIGIIGFGNIGKLVAKYAHLMDLKVLINDSPLYDEGYNFPDYAEHCDYETIFNESDIITNHVPLTYDGKYATKNLINKNLLNNLKKNALFIHASRGGIVNENDLLGINKKITFAIDVWENEPDLNKDLLEKCMLASAHTAGYSRDGKLRGVKAMMELLNSIKGTNFTDSKIDNELSEYIPISKEKYSDLNYIYQKIKLSRNFEYDHQSMQRLLYLDKSARKTEFDLIRKNYPSRREVL